MPGPQGECCQNCYFEEYGFCKKKPIQNQDGPFSGGSLIPDGAGGFSIYSNAPSMNAGHPQIYNAWDEWCGEFKDKNEVTQLQPCNPQPTGHTPTLISDPSGHSTSAPDPQCDCGAAKTGGTHADWCSTKK